MSTKSRTKTFTTQAEVAAACIEMTELWYRRVYHMRSANRILLSTKALIRHTLGYQRDLPAPEIKKIIARTSRIVDAALENGAYHADDAALAEQMQPELSAMSATISIFNDFRHDFELKMKRLSRAFPFWQEWQDVNGFTELGLAIIIAEAGDLSKYSTHSKLRKRLGLAPFTKDGVTRACSTWRMKGGLESEDWRVTDDDGNVNINGPLYKKERRSFIFSQIGVPIIGCMGKGPRPLMGEDIDARDDLTKYQKFFVRRLRLEVQKDAAQGRPTTAEGKESFSKFAAMRAQRATEQRLIRDVWQTWRRAAAAMGAVEGMREAA
jgi:hypothetical protein